MDPLADINSDNSIAAGPAAPPANPLPPVSQSPPVDLPDDPAEFWRVGPEFASLQLPRAADQPALLELLGPPPFPKSGFPFVGFLATIYDHVTGQVARGRHPDAG